MASQGTVMASSLGVRYSLPLLLGIALMLAELQARLGLVPIRFLRGRSRNPLEALGEGWLHGLVLLGMFGLGLGSCGLLRNGVVWVLLMGGVLLTWRMGLARSPIRAAVAKAGLSPFPWTLGAGLLGLAVTWTACSSGVFEDAFSYHLSFPWTALQLHRIPLDHVPFVFRVPLLVDQSFVLPLTLGDDRLVKLMLAASYMACAAAVAGLFLRRNSPHIAFVPALLALSVPTIFWIPGLPKNDAGAIALFVAGAVIWRAHRNIEGAFFLGASCAAKLSCGPLVLAWVVMYPPRGRRWALNLVSLVVTLLPWMLKAWLTTADPLFPLLWRWCPGPFWNGDNQSTFDRFGRDPGSRHLASLSMAWLRSMWVEYPLFLLCFPVLWLVGRRRGIVALLLGTLGALYAGGFGRYIAPGIWLAAVEIAEGLGGDRTWSRRVLLGIVSAGWLLQVRASPSLRPDDVSVPIYNPVAARSRQWSTWGQAITELGTGSTRTTLLTGGWRNYPFPSRPVCDGFWGETPQVWSMVRESVDPVRIRIRFRQLNIGTILHNVVSVDLTASMRAWYPWSARMTSTYLSFCRQYLDTRDAPHRIDRSNGGFYCLDVAPSPHANLPHLIPCLPGAESLMVEGRTFLERPGHELEAIAAFAKIGESHRVVGYFASRMADAYKARKDWGALDRLLAPHALTGYVDGHNLPRLAEAATHLGRHDMAIEIWRRVLKIYDAPLPNRVNLAWALEERARQSIRSARPSDAARDLQEADELLSTVPQDPKAEHENSRRQNVALLAGLQADLMMTRGETRRAIELYERACAMAPELPEAIAWRKQLHGPEKK